MAVGLTVEHIKVGAGKRCWCIECKKAYHKTYNQQWEKKHRLERNERRRTESYRQQRKLYAGRVNMTAKRSEYHRIWYQQNKERVRAKMDKWRTDNLDKWNGYSRKRRALLRGAKSEPYSLAEIYERDKGICQICFTLVHIEAIKLRDKATIDHIIPIYKGGDDTKNNVQLAHHGCNSGKRHYV